MPNKHTERFLIKPGALPSEDCLEWITHFSSPVTYNPMFKLAQGNSFFKHQETVHADSLLFSIKPFLSHGEERSDVATSGINAMDKALYSRLLTLHGMTKYFFLNLFVIFFVKVSRSQSSRPRLCQAASRPPRSLPPRLHSCVCRPTLSRPYRCPRSAASIVHPRLLRRQWKNR